MRLWQLCEKVSSRLKAKDLAGGTVTLKLKSADFRSRTRATTLEAPTQLAEVLFRAGAALLERETDGTAYRLIGIGASALTDASRADPLDLLDPDAGKRAKVERVIDAVRDKLGADAISKGRGLRRKTS